MITCQEARERKVAQGYTILSSEVLINNGYLNNTGEPSPCVPLCFFSLAVLFKLFNIFFQLALEEGYNIADEEFKNIMI